MCHIHMGSRIPFRKSVAYMPGFHQRRRLYRVPVPTMRR